MDRKFQKALLQLLTSEPLLGGVASRCRWVEEANPNGTLAYTDGRRIVLHPELAKFDVPQISFAMAHELMHVVLMHTLRAPPDARMATVWNIAIDAVLNRSLMRSESYRRGVLAAIPGIVDSLRQYGISDTELDGMTEEDAYNELLRRMPPDMAGGSGGPGDGDTAAPSDGDGDGDGDGGNGGSGNGDPLGSDIRPAADDAMTKQEVQAVAASVNVTKSVGRTSGYIGEHLVKELLRPTVSWRSVLMDCMQRVAGDVDRTWSRRSRRHSSTILPGYETQRIVQMTVVLDVSGSCYSMVTKFLSELKGLVEQVDVERIVVALHDTDIMRAWDSETEGVPPSELVGSIARSDASIPIGGGTSIGRSARTLLERYPETELVVWMTDLVNNDWVGVEALPTTMWMVSEKDAEHVDMFIEGSPVRAVGQVVVMEDIS